MLCVVATAMVFVGCQPDSVSLQPQPSPEASPSSVPATKKLNPAGKTADMKFIGLPVNAALAQAKAANIPARIVQIDGVNQPVTMDYRPDRYGFIVENGKVTAIKRG